MNRRDFLKISSMAGLSTILNTSCSNLNIPSDKRTSLLERKLKWSFPHDSQVIKTGQLNPEFDGIRAAAASVVECGDKYRMYYWATDNQKDNSICMAESPVDRPNQWKGIGPALRKQPDTEYNFYGPSFPFVIPVNEKHWLIFFCGWGKKREDNAIPNRTALAESFDGGMTWKYYDKNPIVPLDKEYDKAATGSCWVVRVKNKYRMYYTAISKYFQKPEGVQTGHGDRIPLIGIGYMVSSDGYIWTKPFDDYLIKPRLRETEPYNYIVSKPCVVHEENGWRMWVNTFGYAYRVRSLISTDGVKWEWVESGIDGEFGTGAKGTFDDNQRSYVCVLKYGKEYRCWYTGNNFGLEGMGYATGILE
jgi:hypothetical protein